MKIITESNVFENRQKLEMLQAYSENLKLHKKVKTFEELVNFCRIIEEVSRFTMYTCISGKKSLCVRSESIFEFSGYMYTSPAVVATKIREYAENLCDYDKIKYMFFDGRGIGIYMDFFNLEDFKKIAMPKIKNCGIFEFWDDDMIEQTRKENGTLDSFYILNVTFRPLFNI